MIRFMVGAATLLVIPSVVLFGLDPNLGALLYVILGQAAGALCLITPPRS
jgi:hypothetical protein